MTEMNFIKAKILNRIFKNLFYIYLNFISFLILKLKQNCSQMFDFVSIPKRYSFKF